MEDLEAQTRQYLDFEGLELTVSEIEESTAAAATRVGVCASEADAEEKIITFPDGLPFNAIPGTSVIIVHFPNGNTAESVAFNIEGTDSFEAQAGAIPAGSTVMFALYPND